MFFNCHTGFSFKYGTLSPENLYKEAARAGVSKLIVTEINNTASYMEILRLCIEKKSKSKETGIPYHALDIGVGIEFRKDDDQLLYIGLARNNNGFRQLNKFLSYRNLNGIPLPARMPEVEDAFVVYPWGKIPVEQLRSYEFIGIRKHELNRLAISEEYQEFPDKFVAWHPVTFRKPGKRENGSRDNRDYNTHRLLRAIANNTLLSKLLPEQQALQTEFMIEEDELVMYFKDFPSLLSNARMICEQCSIDIPLGTDKNKKLFFANKSEDLDYLRQETLKGFKRIYGEDNPIVLQRIEKELSVIARKGFTAYYLITYDLILFARKNGYEFVGRGSGANSVVAYCLGITNVDPMELNLYFERFLNEERTSPPDFDIDFSWDNRDAIYDYLFSKYTKDHVCLLGTHVTYQWRSILRELSKVFGLPKEEIDTLVEYPERYRDRDHITSLVFIYASYIIENQLPAYMSIHAGGVLITEEPIYSYTALELPPKGYPVSHFEMHNAEDFGIFKFDILSQRGLGHIKESIQHIKRNKSVVVDINRFSDFKKDEKIKSLLRESKTMGCFYVESPAMRMLLKKLKCEDYLTLVAASSIIRPGVASSGMMRAYIERFHAVKEGKSYEAIHPKIDELMKETYGVMVYQEDVIKVAYEFAGITLTEADVLRRGMSGKYRSREEFEKVKQRFFEECKKRNYEPHVIDRVWYEIESFSGYSFAKGHSASYAVESYQSLYLKAYFPLEFMVGVINNFGGFYKTEFYFHEARMNGGAIEAPCVNTSEYLTTIHGDRIFIGFIHMKGLENELGKNIAENRTSPYKSLDDFLSRVSIKLEQLRLLIRVGAFRFTGKSKQRLLWEAMLYFSNEKARKIPSRLFDTEPMEYPLPPLTRFETEDAFDELEILGFPLCNPFQLLASQKKDSSIPASLLIEQIGKYVTVDGYVVTTKNSWTKKGDLMHFGTFIDEQGEVFDTVHFPDVAKKFPFRGRGFYRIKGKVVEDFGVTMIETTSMEKLPMINKRAEEFMREVTPYSGRMTVEQP